jgi:aspartyl/asparaginyl-tRNA synthetase
MEVQHADVTITAASVLMFMVLIFLKMIFNLDMETMIDNRVVTLRHPKQQAIFKIAAIS